MGYQNLNDADVRMIICDEAAKAYKDAVIKALNEYSGTELGEHYVQYLKCRSVKHLPNNSFRDVPDKDGNMRAMTPQEAAQRYSEKYPNLNEDIFLYANQFFQHWWQKELPEDHPAQQYSAYQWMDDNGKVFSTDKDGKFVDYLACPSVQ